MKIIYTTGLPASGKTTYARKLQDINKKLVRVNKDDLRAMLHVEFNKDNETFTVAVRDAIIKVAHDFNRDVISDDTNFNKSHQRRFIELARQLNVDSLEHHEVNTPTYVCIDRDTNRAKPVGSQVIQQIEKRYQSQIRLDGGEWVASYNVWKEPLQPYKPDGSLSAAIICDLDGTLAIHTNRGPYDTAKCETDEVNMAVSQMIAILQHGFQLFFFSGREDRFRPQTVAWLSRHGYKPEHYELYMRPTGDFRPDDVIKLEIFDRVIRDKYNVLVAFDDRDRIVSLWRNLGLTCFQVADGNF